MFGKKKLSLIGPLPSQEFLFSFSNDIFEDPFLSDLDYDLNNETLTLARRPLQIKRGYAVGSLINLDGYYVCSFSKFSLSENIKIDINTEDLDTESLRNFLELRKKENEEIIPKINSDPSVLLDELKIHSKI